MEIATKITINPFCPEDTFSSVIGSLLATTSPLLFSVPISLSDSPVCIGISDTEFSTCFSGSLELWRWNAGGKVFSGFINETGSQLIKEEATPEGVIAELASSPASIVSPTLRGSGLLPPVILKISPLLAKSQFPKTPARLVESISIFKNFDSYSLETSPSGPYAFRVSTPLLTTFAVTVQLAPTIAEADTVTTFKKTKEIIIKSGKSSFFIMIKNFSSPKIKIWFEPMFFSGFFCGFEWCGSAAFPNFRGRIFSEKCVRTNSRILHQKGKVKEFWFASLRSATNLYSILGVKTNSRFRILGEENFLILNFQNL